ncbi:Sodium/calcium exchanger protein-domain-containing protein [Gautieria morchelliformis]|nr:Sodium/calcium exchanger protein-domain-containing protein [Gautieria morchelliformis]
MPSESSPLLENGAALHESPPQPCARRLLSFVKGEGQPGFLQSYHFLFLESWVNLLLLFIPLSAISHYLNWDAGLRFLLSFLAIIPLAKLIGEATEELSIELGQTLSGLLNASFGNAVEIIVGVAALLQGELRIVQTSMLGSILGNILLVLGSSFIAGGFMHEHGEFQETAAQTSASLMTLGCITLVIPAAYHAQPPNSPLSIGESVGSSHLLASTPDTGDSLSKGLNIISRGTAILLLIVYISYLFFQLKTHTHLFRPPPDQEDEDKTAGMSTFAAATSLLLVTVLTSFCADWLVASIEETAEVYHISKPFIGHVLPLSIFFVALTALSLILIPIVANAAEHTTSIWMAVRGKYELAIGICIGSSIQIALFVVPLLVLVGWISGHNLTMFFSDFETIILFVSVVLVNLLIMDGKCNYMEGLMLVTLYIVIALAFWVD